MDVPLVKNIRNAHQMKDVLLSHDGVEGVRVAVTDFLEESVSGKLCKIAGISKLNNFCFTSGKLIAWRAYALGSGELLNVAMNSGKN